MNAAYDLINRVLILVFFIAGALATAPRAEAQQPSPSSSGLSVATIGKFLGGAAIGFGAHEAGHLVLNLSVGVTPGLRRVSFAKIPFFAITHPSVSPVREFAISSAGFRVQEGLNEVLLTQRPRLRTETAPLVKGLLAFNTLASFAYAGVAFTRYGPDERDTRGMALAAGVDERVVGVTLVAPAAFDAARYYKPESRWLRWASRVSKIAAAMLVLKARGQ